MLEMLIGSILGANIIPCESKLLNMVDHINSSLASQEFSIDMIIYCLPVIGPNFQVLVWIQTHNKFIKGNQVYRGPFVN